jgi:peptidoglycan hydrolase-like protein with peptidoglycan-binding domain
MSGSTRDLVDLEHWTASLRRSQERRARSNRGRRPTPRPPASIQARSRDLADGETWELSLGRSRARRRAAQLRFVPASTRAKRLSIGTLAALTVGPTTAAVVAGGSGASTAAAAGPEPATTTEHAITLGPGSEGRQVRLLQAALGIPVDGVYGPQTEAAVSRFQRAHGIQADGVAGPATTAALRGEGNGGALPVEFAEQSPLPRSAPASRESPSPGSAGAVESDANQAPPAGQPVEEAQPTQGDAEPTQPTGSAEDAVVRLQRALHLTPDGEFGPSTEAAVRRLQARHGLSVDGIVGPETWGLIGIHDAETLTPPPSALPQRVSHHAHTAVQPAAESESQAEPERHESAADSGMSAVERLQKALKLPIDGEFGPSTEAAVMRLQSRHGLTPDGVVGPETWALLGIHSEATLTPPASARAAAEAESHHSEGSGEGDASGSSSSAGGGEGAVGAVIAAGDEIATRPYVWGGGHGSFQSSGYDCSGSVSYALHGGGLLSSPEDSSEFESYGEPGPGRYITIYANAEHVFMVVDGKRFDTVALAETGSRWSDSMTSTGGYVVRHPPGM